MWANKAEKCLPFMLNPSGPPPLPPSYYANTGKRTHATHTHTPARTHDVHKSSNALLTTSHQLLSVNKHTPTYSSDRIDADV